MVTTAKRSGSLKGSMISTVGSLKSAPMIRTAMALNPRSPMTLEEAESPGSHVYVSHRMEDCHPQYDRKLLALRRTTLDLMMNSKLLLQEGHLGSSLRASILTMMCPGVRSSFWRGRASAFHWHYQSWRGDGDHGDDDNDVKKDTKRNHVHNKGTQFI